MKKIFALAMTGSLFFAACTKADLNDDVANDLAPSTGRKCGSYEVLEQQMAADPTLRTRMQQIEEFTQRTISDPASYRLLSDGTMEIPVVFNVLYNTAAQNVSLTQLQSQIDVLNEDYSATNTDYNNTPSIFQAVRSGDTRIRFVLDQVVRKQTNKTSWTTNDAMKKSAQGGIDATSPTTKLNIWVCNLSGGILGYAQFPGGKAATDGVVLDDNATGRTGTVTAPYNKGRTATHEIGHWFNLRHIWGDTNCGSDLVNDTPLHNAANYGCPAAGHKSTCTGTPVEMTMNYMDYTDDACMYMFSAGQKARMQATYAVGGPRASFR